jgi:nitrite reductase/ring-hydroxylating ferredoxin subunit
MGELMRQYWVPALMSSELAPDGAPLRLRLLGEPLIAFRDSSGRVGIMDQKCPHRCASLFFGRNEHDGIRCVYHGWKFYVEGNCVDAPNLPGPLATHNRIKAKAYSVREGAGLIWVYMGPRETPPELPGLQALALDDAELSIWCLQRQSNYLQAMEGDIDTSHLGFLHGGMVQSEDPALANRAPKYKVVDTEVGVLTRRPYELRPDAAKLINFISHSLRAAIAGGALDRVAEVSGAAPDIALSQVTLLPPITDLDKIICAGRNYRAHATEAGGPPPENPQVFLRLVNTLVAHNQPMVCPRISGDFDYEGELAVIIGKPGRHIAISDALSHVFGYTCFNDGSIRDIQFDLQHDDRIGLRQGLFLRIRPSDRHAQGVRRLFIGFVARPIGAAIFCHYGRHGWRDGGRCAGPLSFCRTRAAMGWIRRIMLLSGDATIEVAGRPLACNAR